MSAATVQRSNMTGALCVIVAMSCFSLNDMGIKFLSDAYALHQVVLVRALVGLTTFFIVIMPFYGGFSVFRTRRLGAHILRGFCVVCANTLLFLGLSVLPIADAIAVFFISPMANAILSVLVLKETVDTRRWVAIFIGFAGVMIIVKPGTSAFQVASLFPMFAAFLYACMNIVARRIGDTESAGTMMAYVQLTFIVLCVLSGLLIGDGRFASAEASALDFLFRAWGPISPDDYPILIMLGVSGAFGVFFISQGYRISETAFAASFEYVSLPLAIMWGVTVFGTWPAPSAWIGIGLIMGAGMYLFWRESRARPAAVVETGSGE